MMERHDERKQQVCPGNQGKRTSRSWTLWLRAGLLIIVAAAVGVIVYGLWPKPQEAAGEYDRKVTMTMAGFDPRVIELPAGEPSTLWLVNPDSPYHTDGGGVHGFTVPGLGIDFRVQPRSNLLVEIPAAEPGEYPFYCDTCCGGKDSPSMQGVLRLTG